MFLYDDLDIYKNKKCRSSYYVLELWEEYIEKDLIANLGMRKNLMISIYLDSDALFYSITSDYKSILTKNITTKINHIISALYELSTTINITINNCEKFNLDFSICSYFFDKNNLKDEGSIEVDCFSFCNIQNYKLFKTKLLMKLSKEFQYAVQKNYLQKDINIDPACFFDSEYEMINTCQIIDKVSFFEAMEILNKDQHYLKIDKNIFTQINNIIEKK